MDFNKDKAKYDLALIYAKTKLEYALKNNTFNGQENTESDYLYEKFISAITNFDTK